MQKQHPFDGKREVNKRNDNDKKRRRQKKRRRKDKTGGMSVNMLGLKEMNKTKTFRTTIKLKP